MSNYSKGSDGEYELIDIFEEEGFRAMRAPGSGTTERESPDLVIGNGETYYAFEVKRWKRDEYKYVEKRELEELWNWAEEFGAEPFLAVRFNYGDWAFFKKEELHSTDKNYRVDRVKVPEAQSLEELL